MLRCPNPSCPSRKRLSLTQVGLFRHFRSSEACEKAFNHSQLNLNTDTNFNEEDNPNTNSTDDDNQPPPLIPCEQVYFPSLNDPESHARYYYHPDSADFDKEDDNVGLPPDSDGDPDDNEDDLDDKPEDDTQGGKNTITKTTP
jgi:hypothetical protein